MPVSEIDMRDMWSDQMDEAPPKNTVGALKAALALLPDETVVKVVEGYTQCWDYCASFVDADVSECSDNYDLVNGTLYLGRT